MREHHRLTISALVERVSVDPTFLAVIIGGSLAKGLEQELSDVDGFLVVTDEEFARRAEAGDVCYITRDLAFYPGGYVDFKTVDLGFLADAAERGSEPARSAFQGAFIAWARLPQLDSLIARIPVYPAHEHREKVLGFLGQIVVWRGLLAEAEKRQDTYLRRTAASKIVLFASRLVLAHNRILYPYHKWLMTYVQRADDKPDGFVELAEALLDDATAETAERFFDSLMRWPGWEQPPGNVFGRFVQESEWNWRDHRPPLEDW